MHRAVALEAHRHELHVGVAVLPRDCDRAIREREAVAHPVVHHGTIAGEHVEPGVHPRLGRAFEQCCGATQPACADRTAPVGGMPRRRGESHAGGVDRSAGRLVAGERPLERIGRLIGLAGPPGGLAHPLEVVGRQAASPSAAANASSASAQACRLTASLPSSSEPAAAEFHLMPRRIEQLPSDYPRRPQPAGTRGVHDQARIEDPRAASERAATAR